MLNNEEEKEIDRQAREIKIRERLDITIFLIIAYYVIAIALVFFLGAEGLYFLLGSISTGVLMIIIKRLK